MSSYSTRTIGTALRNMRRSPYQALAAIMMMSLTFFVAYASTLMVIGAELVLHYFETRPQVTAFFTTTSSADDLNSAASLMKSKSYVASIHVVTKSDALAQYREENKKDPLLLELVTADILPASIEVSAKNIESLPKIRDDLSKLPGVDEVIYQKDVISNLSFWTRGIRIVGAVIVGFLGLTTLIFIAVILSLRIAMKRQEMAIMRLLGASLWYIRAPFLVEGILYGLIGAIVGWIACVTLLLYLTPSILYFFGSIFIRPLPPIFLLEVLAGGLLCGLVVGFLSSLAAVKRLIKH